MLTQDIKSRALSIAKSVIQHKAFYPTVAASVAFPAGVVAGYIFAKRKLTTPEEYLDYDDGEAGNIDVYSAIDEAKYHKLVSEYQDESELETLANEEYSLGVVDEEVVLEEISSATEERVQEFITKNIFAKSSDDWDYEEEKKNRANARIYPIHKDEFFAEESGFDQLTITYYAGDDILVDEEQAPVFNHRAVVGELRFGYGSGDASLCYIRNEDTKAEYEIILFEGLYSVEVLGLELEENERAREASRRRSAKHPDRELED